MKYFSKENGPVVITFDHDEVKITQELPWDADAATIIQAVYTAMIGMTFYPDGVIRAMQEFVEEHKQVEEWLRDYDEDDENDKE